jgi:predicted alpha/beta-hydrolase family hydrolase
MATAVRIAIESGGSVSGLWDKSAKARAALVLAHGAGAGMQHKSMEAIAKGLSARGVVTLRFQFPYMERGSKRPDSPAVAQAAVRAAVADAKKRAGALPLFAGGKSFGGRMTSQAEAKSPLGVKGLIFFGFPLHLAGAPAVERAVHLKDVKVPMLFLSGTRDALADVTLLKKTMKGLGSRATLALFEDADHSFHVPAKTGRKDAEVLAEILDAAAEWMEKHQ